MKILIPMAGEGSRFVNAGYTFPKPLIEIGKNEKKLMIQCVVDNLRFNAEYIFLVRKEHLEKYNIEQTLKNITNNKCAVITVNSLTDGAACTALLAQEYINSDEELLIANSDQFIKYSSENFNTFRKFSSVDGIIFTFHSTHPKWSFVKTNINGEITEVAEKNPISNIATCGIYYFRHGKDFVNAAKQMIEKNKRVNNEFYIAPVYNEMINQQKVLVPFFVDEMHGLGTPEDLELFNK